MNDFIGEKSSEKQLKIVEQNTICSNAFQTKWLVEVATKIIEIIAIKSFTETEISSGFSVSVWKKSKWIIQVFD